MFIVRIIYALVAKRNLSRLMIEATREIIQRNFKLNVSVKQDSRLHGGD